MTAAHRPARMYDLRTQAGAYVLPVLLQIVCAFDIQDHQSIRNIRLCLQTVSSCI